MGGFVHFCAAGKASRTHRIKVGKHVVNRRGGGGGLCGRWRSEIVLVLVRDDLLEIVVVLVVRRHRAALARLATVVQLGVEKRNKEPACLMW